MDFDPSKIFVNDLSWMFAVEIVGRTLIMFTMVVLVLRLSGKKGVRQLSLFEVAIIIALGSAAGDPMFNKDVAILPAVIVIATILAFYRTLTWLAAKYESFEGILEGRPTCVIEEGMFIISEENKHTFAKEEFFAEMRQQSIEHLGQVKLAVLETNGNVSFFYYEDEEVKPGLPVLPKLYHQRHRHVPHAGDYACTYCGYVAHITTTEARCKRCSKDEWVKALDTRRIS